MKSFDLRFMLPKPMAMLLLAVCLTACNSLGLALPDQTLDEPGRANSSTFLSSNMPVSRQGASLMAEDTLSSVSAPVIVRGSNELPTISAATNTFSVKDGEYVLNFDNADIRDVLKAVLADMLGLGYAVDPAVQGSISLRTAKPVSRAAVLPAFEEALKLAGAALVPGASGYQVVPLSAAAQRGTIGTAGSALRPGYQVRLVPLRHVAAADVQRVLEPLVAPGTVVPVSNPNASLITLAGTASEVDRAERAIAMFDVDWLRSQSFGLFPLRYSSAGDVAEDLNNVVGKQGPLAGVVRIAPITHLNAILIVSKNFSHINQMKTWVERFDRGREVLKPRLFVYYVQNGRARDLATVLTRVFAQSRGGSNALAVTAADDAPSIPDGINVPGQSVAAPSLGAVSMAGRGPSGSSFSAPPSSLPNNSSSASSAPDNAVGTSSQQADLRITADEVNNALLIMATPQRYAQIEAALIQLDAAPLQVMLEASIAEVDVNDKFKYGVQASFERGAFSTLSSAVAASALAASTGGLSAALVRGDIKATLDLLSTLTKVRVISAPKLLVLNNRTASLQVGDQVPIATSSAVSTITPNAPTVNTIQLYDTGIILRVTPRVNRNGLVLMDLSQEVSASVPTNTSTLNSPTIQQRRVSTSVAVADGQTIAIGGLMRDNRTIDRTGIPFLKDIPGAGALFGINSDRIDRTELMVLITPRVIRSPAGADAATDELSAKLPMLQGLRASRVR